MEEKTNSQIPYDTMVMQALKSVVRGAVELASNEGLPGEHHFFLTFRTDHPMAELPDSLAAKYPVEIRIVLQNQFSNLYVDDFGFHVTLYFGGMPTPLYVPFDAITSFLDPHVQFSMNFEPMGMAIKQQKSRNQKEQVEEVEKPANKVPKTKSKAKEEEKSNVVDLSSFRKS